MNEQEFVYVSVSDYAKKRGVSTTIVYNWIRHGTIDAIKFQRGKMNGWLVKCAK